MRKFLLRAFLVVLISSFLITINFLSIQLGNHQKKPSILAIHSAVFKKKLEDPAPEWMLNQIKSDLKRYQEGITSQMLNEGFYGEELECRQLVRFHIKQRCLTVSVNERIRPSHHVQELCAAIKTLNELIPLPDIDFIISLQDGFDRNPNLPHCPWLVFSKTIDNDMHLLMPDLTALRGHDQLRKMIYAGNQAHPWNKKKAQAFWRGATTGGTLTTTNWDQIPRAKLVLFSLERPKKIDARFNKVVQAESGVAELLHKKGLISKTVKKVDHLNYKYLIDIDGNVSTFERLFWLLLSNSLVLKQQSPYIQWYYGALEPYRHFLPIKEDLSDLLQQIEWAQNHDYEARNIAKAASRFAQEHLSNEDILLYLTLLLREYAILYKSI